VTNLKKVFGQDFFDKFDKLVTQGGEVESEYWADIPGFPRYAVTSHGEIYNKVYKRIMRQSVADRYGHLKVSLIDEDNVRRSCGVAQLVAQAFVERPNHRCTHIIHLDGRLDNVWAHNLAWRTPRTAYLFSRQEHLPKRPEWYNLSVQNMSTGVVYANIIECGKAEGVVYQEVWESINSSIFNQDAHRRVPPYGHTYQIIKRV
jgi:hypothetical protein